VRISLRSKNVTRPDGDDYPLDSTVDPETNEISQYRLFSTTTKQPTRWSLTERHCQSQLDNVEFFVETTDYLVNVLIEVGPGSG
jgi:hypothetical protein